MCSLIRFARSKFYPRLYANFIQCWISRNLATSTSFSIISSSWPRRATLLRNFQRSNWSLVSFLLFLNLDRHPLWHSPLRGSARRGRIVAASCKNNQLAFPVCFSFVFRPGDWSLVMSELPRFRGNSICSLSVYLLLLLLLLLHRFLYLPTPRKVLFWTEQGRSTLTF